MIRWFLASVCCTVAFAQTIVINGPGGGQQTWPSGSAGLTVYSGSSSWQGTVPAPTGSIVGTTDTQTLSNKTIFAPQINTKFYADGFPTSCTVAATNYTTQWDCAKATAINWITTNDQAAVLVAGDNIYSQCADLALPRSASGYTLSMEGQGWDKSQVNQTCLITDPMVYIAPGSPKPAGHIRGIYFNAQSNAPKVMGLYGIYGTQIRDNKYNGGTDGTSMVQFGSTATNGSDGNLIIANLTDTTIGGAAPRATASASISGGTITVIVTAGGGTTTGYTGATATVWILGRGGNGNGTANASNTSKWVCGTMPSNLTVPVSGGAVTTGTYTFPGGVNCDSPANLYVQIQNTGKWNYIFDLQNVFDSTTQDLQPVGIANIAAMRFQGGAIHSFHDHPYGDSAISFEDHGNNLYFGAEPDSPLAFAFDLEGSNTSIAAVHRLWNTTGPASGANTGYAGSSDFFINTSAGATNLTLNGMCDGTQANGGYNTIVTSSGPDPNLNSSYNASQTNVDVLGLRQCGGSSGTEQTILNGNMRIYGPQVTIYSPSSSATAQMQFQSPRTDMDTLQVGEQSGSAPYVYIKDATQGSQTVAQFGYQGVTFANEPLTVSAISGSSGLKAVAASVPAASIGTIVGGAAGSYSFTCTGLDPVGGETTASAAASTSVGPTTLDSSHTINVKCANATGVVSANVYRTAGGASQGLIGNVAPNGTLTDNGIVAGAAAPTSNNTGNLAAANCVVLGSTLSGESWCRGTGAPTGSCVNGSLYSRTDTGALYICQSSAWAVSGNGTPAGSNTAVQYNNSGAFGGDSTNLSYNNSTHVLTATGGFTSGGTTAGFVQLGQGTANSAAANSIGLQAPTSVTAYTVTLPAAAPASNGQYLSVTTAGVGSWVSPVQLIASGTAALGTSAISSATCATVVTVSASGVATTDVIQFTPNADITGVTGYAASTSGGLEIYPYPTANNVNFKVCNSTSSSITPGAVTLNWRVTR